MIHYDQFELANGLQVIVHENPHSPLVSVNVLYDVGSRDESLEKTGFAHLFEHLMFGGSLHIPSYDNIIHKAGGECNAFTSNDFTNYYNVLPVNNLETAFWLESDRMLSLNFNEQSLAVQKSVVIEEFKETHINQPYGDIWHKLLALSYQQHPYRWPVIGAKISHISSASLADVEAFFYRYYRPNNAILSIAGNVTKSQIAELAKKWFGNIPRGPVNRRNLLQEAKQTEFRSLHTTADVPLDAIYLAFKMCGRSSSDYYATDLLSDLLSTGNSSRLFQELIKEQQLFSSIQAYGLGNFDVSLFCIQGKLRTGVTMEQAEAAIWQTLDKFSHTLVDDYELTKAKNKVETAIAFSEISLMNQAFLLAYHHLLGNIATINTEIAHYLAVSKHDIQRIARTILRKTNCSTIYYHKKQAIPANN